MHIGDSGLRVRGDFGRPVGPSLYGDQPELLQLNQRPPFCRAVHTLNRTIGRCKGCPVCRRSSRKAALISTASLPGSARARMLSSASGIGRIGCMAGKITPWRAKGTPRGSPGAGWWFFPAAGAASRRFGSPGVSTPWAGRAKPRCGTGRFSVRVNSGPEIPLFGKSSI